MYCEKKDHRNGDKITEIYADFMIDKNIVPIRKFYGMFTLCGLLKSLSVDDEILVMSDEKIDVMCCILY